jgi:hypothetical protein
MKKFMNNNHWNKVTVGTLSGLVLLLLAIGFLYLSRGLPVKPVYDYALLGVAALIVIILVIYIIQVIRGKITQTEPDYRALFMIGIIFLPLGMGSNNRVFLVFSLVFLGVGLANRKKWKVQPKFSELPLARQKFKIFTMVILGIVVLASFLAWWYFETQKKSSEKNTINQPALSEQTARIIAEQSCVKGGEALSVGVYNENSQTWWFDANLNAAREGCNPACVVSESTKTAEINWRCTGLILPEESVKAAILQKFKEKYPKYADTVVISISKQDDSHARGMVSMVAGQEGGIFLAVKIDDKWQIVFDGNGGIPCNLAKYGFSADMLDDCAN